VRDRAGTPVPAHPPRLFGADKSGGGWWWRSPRASGVGSNRSAAPNTALQPDAPDRADFGRCSKIGVVLVSQPFAPRTAEAQALGRSLIATTSHLFLLSSN
jgi:hypothetical protein